jgi:precorrin-2 methylase
MPIRRLLLIGIGAGDPSFVTARAAGAIDEVDAFLVIDKGEAKEELVGVRRQVLIKCRSRNATAAHRLSGNRSVDHRWTLSTLRSRHPDVAHCVGDEIVGE